MSGGKMKIGIVAPSCRIEPLMAEKVKEVATELYSENTPDLVFHPQCFLSDGHFAGNDQDRAEAFIEVANDPSYNAIWFARGGYGAGRLLETVLPALKEEAREKTYLGYSDNGFLLGALYGQGYEHIVHGPIPADIMREDGIEAVKRSLRYLVEKDYTTFEPNLRSSEKTVAFNITILGKMIGTPYLPDLTGHVLMLEEVSEYMYAIDRALFQITSSPELRKVAGIRLGRCSDIPENDPDFIKNEVDVIEYWCKRSGIPYLGRADIGHDTDNKIVPFG